METIKSYHDKYNHFVIDISRLTMSEVKEKVAAYKTLFDISHANMLLDGHFLDVTLGKKWGGLDVTLSPFADDKQNVRFGNKYFMVNYRVNKRNHTGKMKADAGKYGYSHLVIIDESPTMIKYMSNF